jgi:hypothetical protein
LVSEAPIQKIGKFYTISIEKMLVDIFCEENSIALFKLVEFKLFKRILDNNCADYQYFRQ